MERAKHDRENPAYLLLFTWAGIAPYNRVGISLAVLAGFHTIGWHYTFELVLILFPIFSIAFVAMGYELIEWSYAATAGGASGAAFLGSQGDIWEAGGTSGAVAATTLFFARGYGKISLLPMDSSVMENVRSSPAKG